MKPEPQPEAIKHILAENPQVAGVRIDAAKHDLEIGFAETVPPAPVLEQIDASLSRELPDPESVMHSSTVQHAAAAGADGFHHHHLGEGVIEFHRGHAEPRRPVLWRKFKVPRWENRQPAEEEGAGFRIELLLAGLCGLAGLAGYFASRAELAAPWQVFAFATAYLCGGWYPTKEVIENLREGRIDVHFLMIVVAIGALFVNAWAEGAVLLFLFSLSGGLEQFAHYRTQKTLNSLMKAAPKQALRREADQWVEVAIEAVRVDDELLVKPGELFPVDGTLVEGATSADEAALTGESIPVAKEIGATVSGGTLNLEGQAVIRVLRLPRESAVQRIVALIESAQQQKAPAQRFTDTFGRYYTWGVLGLSAVVFVFLLARHHPMAEAFYRTMTLLVVASPCALVLSIPSAILVAIASGARRGILFRGGVAVENLAGIDQFAFDKTGTLTKGNLRVARIVAMNGASEDEVLRLAADVGQYSTHPLSRAIVTEAARRNLPLDPVVNFQNLTGLGMQAECHGELLLVGSRRLLETRGLALEVAADDHAEVEVWVAGTKPLGVVRLSDELRPEARGVIAQLQRAGAGVTLLTGDRAAVANQIAAALGIRDVRAGLSPADKLECVHRWQAEGRKVAMVGDGINDAPSLTAADVAIGMGARGSDAALEQADVVLMNDKIENIAEAVRLSRRARRIIRQNLVISLGVVVLLVVSALWNKIGLSLGVVGHEGSTVVVVLNGLRLLRAGPRQS
jgi:Cd2+/Zn2+-exporting ATPase